MKHFLYVVFGGLTAIVCALALAQLVPSIYSYIFEHQLADGTAVIGIKRIIRYTANQEEDLINTAVQALPDGAGSDISADAYILRDLISGKTIASNNIDKIRPIASLTKLVTAVIARRTIPPYTPVTITPDIMTAYGNTAQFRIGETFLAENLMYPLIMVSSNDAAEAFARTYGRTRFIQAMNDFVQSIGAYRTSFSDPSGLSPLNVSTARDISIILDWMRVNEPEIISITNLKSKTVRSHTWVNSTHFLNWSNYIGGKNGYTDQAQSTGAALFTMGHNKDTYAVVVLGSHSRDADVVKLLEKVSQ